VIQARSQQAIAAGQTAFTETDYAELRSLISDFLPDSYGVGEGCLADRQGRRSAFVHLLIYDRILAPDVTLGSDGVYPLQPTLAVFDVALQHDWRSLNVALDTIQSVKRLRSRSADTAAAGKRAAERAAGSIPKSRLPIGVLYFQRILDMTPDMLFADLYARFSARPPAVSSVGFQDYIHAIEHGVLYRNPLLGDQPLTGYESGLLRQPKRIKPQLCHICGISFYERHFFYDRLCPRCADLNYAKRVQTADLTGKIALVTGARIKIGYAVALRLLRAGAQVIGVTRFPRDAARRYTAEPDFAVWRDRLHLYALNLCYTPGVEAFAKHLCAAYPQLDILINNAAQTVRRLPEYYAHLIADEMLPIAELPAPIGALVQPPDAYTTADTGFPFLLTGGEASDLALDRDGQPLDNRTVNSWTLKLEAVTLPEVLEVQLINVTAPYVLISQLKALMMRGAGIKHIVNVSAVEGQFKQSKRGIHPHTNMAKAALNMLTHTAASDFAESGIFMNSVDPGWVSNQAPAADDEAHRRQDALLPLDMQDAAARICDPVFSGSAGEYGHLLKNYGIVPW